MTGLGCSLRGVYFLPNLRRLPATWTQTGHSNWPGAVSFILILWVLHKVRTATGSSLADTIVRERGWLYGFALESAPGQTPLVALRLLL